MIKLCFFVCFWFFFTISCKELTLKTIFFESEDAILSKNITKNEEILEKYFLTDNKSQSVWTIAQATAKELFKVDYFIDDLSVMEQDIHKIGRQFLNCKEYKNEQKISECFSVVADILRDATRDFTWSYDPTIFKWDRIKYGTMFLTLAVFEAHISLAAKQAPLAKKYEFGKRYGFIFDRFNSLMFDFENALNSWRLDQVTPVKICEVHLIMWKEFEGTCETRWRRSADEDEKGISSGMGSSYDVESLIDEKVEKLGTNLFHKKKYKATVYDSASDHQVFQEEIILDTGSRGIGIHDIFQRAKDARWKYIDTIKNDMPRYNEDVVHAVRNIIESMIRYFKH